MHIAATPATAAAIAEPDHNTTGSAAPTPLVSISATHRSRIRQVERETAIQLTEISDTPEDERAVRAAKTK